MELVSHNLKIDFLRHSKIPILISLVLVVTSLYLWFSMGDAKYGVDFKGGHEFVVKLPGVEDTETLRKLMEEKGIEGATVQRFEIGSHEYSLRIPGDAEAKATRSKVETALKESFPDKHEIIRNEFIGPTIGREMRNKALVATLIGLIVILAYVSYRFEFAFALGAVVALFHDVTVAMGFYLWAGFPVNMSTLAAALSIVGYSVNDTIVIFDRVREEILKDKNFDLIDVVNRSINVTLARTIVTSLLTLFSAMALVVFGGGAIADLSLFLFVGIVAGCYSTIFIASPVVLAWDKFTNKREVTGKSPKTSAAA